MTSRAELRRDAPATALPPAQAAPSSDELRLAMLNGQNRVIELLARGAPAALSLARVAELVEQMVDGALCAILMLDNGNEHLDCVAAPSLVAAREALSRLPVRPADGPHGAVVARGEPVVIADLLSDTLWPGWRRSAMAQGLRALWAVPVLGPDGEVVGVIALHFRAPYLPSAADLRHVDALCPLTGVVIAGERRAREVRSAEERFDSLAANLPGVIYQRVVRPDGSIRYTYISEGVRDLFGVSPQEILHNPQALFDRHGPEYRETFRQNLLAASRELKLWDVEAQMVTRDGQEKWTHAIARPRRQPDGTVVWDGIVLDATRLKQANFELAAANRAKSEFLANVSHELRTPLNAIIGFSEIILGEMFGPLGSGRYRDYLSDIRDSGNHLLGVINDILDLSKIEAGRMQVIEQPVELAPTIDTILRMVEERAKANRIAIEVALPGKPPCVLADERLVKQILINLMSNAVKFTPAGGRITVGAALQADGGIAISVADTGIGIPAEDLPMVCSPFWQIDRGLNRKFEGTGLGLSLCKRMAELHGGRLELQSELGKGTTVTLHLPKRRVLDDPSTL